MIFFYRIGIYIYTAAIHVASLFSSKAKKWVNGRKNWQQHLPVFDSCIWVHCSSLGEFEQGRPFIEKVKKMHPKEKIVLTFFSPSGYEIRKNYPFADAVLYLPIDTPANAKKLLNAIHPKAAIFVKYDFWFCYLQALQQKNIPHFLISAVFSAQHFIFKKWATSFRNIIQQFTTIFVQTKESAHLLEKFGFQNVQLAGDTRVERVLKIKEEPFDNETITSFLQNQKAFIIGSAWKEDLAIIHQSFQNGSITEKIIIVPHEINAENLVEIGHFFGKRNIALYTEYDAQNDAQKPILIVNTIGLLAYLYRYAQRVYIGGGFGKSIHNTLEPAVYEIPLFFGPRFNKFPEAVYFIQKGIATRIQDAESFENAYKNKAILTAQERANLASFFAFHQNASTTILQDLKEKKILL